MLSSDRQTDRQTDKQTNATKNITSFANEEIYWPINICLTGTELHCVNIYATPTLH